VSDPGDIARDARFSIGEVVQHRFHPFRGVVFDVDPTFANTEEWWFPTDSAVLSGDLAVDPDVEHDVRVDLVLYIPYIIVSDTETLHIEENDTKTMKAVAA